MFHLPLQTYRETALTDSVIVFLRQEEVKRLTDRVAFLEDLVRTVDMPRPVSTAHSAGSLDHHTLASPEEKDDSSSANGRLSLPETNALRKRSQSLGAKDEALAKRRKLESGFSPLESIRSMSTPQSPSTIEAQSYILHELEAAKDLSSTRRTVLRSVGELISQLDSKLKVSTNTRVDSSSTGTGLQDIQYPSTEFLCWMLKGEMPSLRFTLLSSH